MIEQAGSSPSKKSFGPFVGPNKSGWVDPNLRAWAWALGPIRPTHVVGPSPTHKLWACLARANFIKEIRPYLGS
jgi:hypothetical protein